MGIKFTYLTKKKHLSIRAFSSLSRVGIVFRIFLLKNIKYTKYVILKINQTWHAFNLLAILIKTNLFFSINTLNQAVACKIYKLR